MLRRGEEGLKRQGACHVRSVGTDVSPTEMALGQLGVHMRKDEAGP